MAYNYINKSGLQYIWNKIKAKFVAKDGDKVLSDNNFTDALKTKLDGIATGANKTTVDTALSSTSTNPVQNKVINSALGGKLSTTGTAAAAKKLATARTVQTNLGSATAASFDGTSNITPGITGTLTVAHGGTGATTAASARTNLGITAANIGALPSGGTAASATKLATGRTIRTNLGSTSTATFDGTANVTPGVTGTLPIANGGTGATTAANARSSLGITPANIGALATSGGTVTGETIFQKGMYVHSANGTSGATGFVNIAQFSLSGTTYQNVPLELTVYRRGTTAPTYLFIEFSSANNADPGLASFKYSGYGDSSSFYMYKSATSTWQLYIKKTESYDNIGIGSYTTNFAYMNVGITWKNGHASSVPSGSTAATYMSVGSASTATTATKLATARTIRTNLASTSTASFDGSANVTPGVTGTLPIANGGTGATTAANARSNLGIGSSATKSLSGSTNTRDAVAYISPDGVMEIGPYIDFHLTEDGTEDYDVRMQITSSNTTFSKPVNVASGGTGLTKSPSMLTNLGSTTAANVLQASPRPGITGTLSVGHGGTGITSNPSLQVNLASGSAASVFASAPRPGVTGILPVSHGGTGVNSETAFKNKIVEYSQTSNAFTNLGFTVKVDYNDLAPLGQVINQVWSAGDYFYYVEAYGSSPYYIRSINQSGVSSVTSSSYTSYSYAPNHVISLLDNSSIGLTGVTSTNVSGTSYRSWWYTKTSSSGVHTILNPRSSSIYNDNGESNVYDFINFDDDGTAHIYVKSYNSREIAYGFYFQEHKITSAGVLTDVTSKIHYYNNKLSSIFAGRICYADDDIIMLSGNDSSSTSQGSMVIKRTDTSLNKVKEVFIPNNGIMQKVKDSFYISDFWGGGIYKLDSNSKTFKAIARHSNPLINGGTNADFGITNTTARYGCYCSKNKYVITPIGYSGFEVYSVEDGSVKVTPPTPAFGSENYATLPVFVLNVKNNTLLVSFASKDASSGIGYILNYS